MGGRYDGEGSQVGGGFVSVPSLVAQRHGGFGQH
jgi:hypothetical protein